MAMGCTGRFGVEGAVDVTEADGDAFFKAAIGFPPEKATANGCAGLFDATGISGAASWVRSGVFTVVFPPKAATSG
jgi:hypothetical protein